MWILRFGKWLLIFTLVFHVLRSNYELNTRELRIQNLEMKVKQLQVVVGPIQRESTPKMDKTDADLLNRINRNYPSPPPMSEHDRAILGRGTIE